MVHPEQMDTDCPEGRGLRTAPVLCGRPSGGQGQAIVAPELVAQWGAEFNTYVLNCGSSPVPMAPGFDSNARHQPDLPSQTVVLRLPLVTKLSAKHRVTHGWRLMRWRPRPVSWIGFELLSPSSCTGISLEKLFKKSNFDGVGCQMFEPSTVFFMAVQSGEHPLIQSSKDPINIINPGWNQWENHRVLLGVLTIQDL